MSDKEKSTETKREGFSTTLGVLAATLGSAVGLGNIWKFPSLTGQNGGAAFVFVYLICVLLIGLPVMISEFIIGRRAGANNVGAFKKLEPSPTKPWYMTGVVGVAAAFLIMFFYTDVAGWVYSYAFKSLTGGFSQVGATETADVFAKYVGSVAGPLVWQWIVLATISVIIIAGVTKGIERMTKTLLPILLVLLLICDIRALTLPGAFAGVEYLFRPDFTKITAGVVLAALGLAFFKLSVGMGTMTTYGSYIGKKENMPANAVKVALSDTLVSILAGLAVFPAVFAFGFQPDAGPSLLFITIPAVFKTMPFGQLFLTMFFVLASIAATGAMISLLEVPVAYLTEEKRWSRMTATLVSAGTMGVIGSLATLSTSTLSDTLVFGKTFFDLFDFASSNIALPVGGILICLFVGWKLGPKVIMDEASNAGALNNVVFLKVFTVLVRYVAPLAILAVLLNGLGIITF
ncbi:MAG: sodium-dependent transporter [Coriobacteriia bacterium]|nr:sodium-dependent transporter [Coriobacteriia bacterium]MBN2821906.1 sodium-dependent transporter [Coriobacteriia bacterium]